MSMLTNDSHVSCSSSDSQRGDEVDMTTVYFMHELTHLHV